MVNLQTTVEECIGLLVMYHAIVNVLYICISEVYMKQTGKLADVKS